MAIEGGLNLIKMWIAKSKKAELSLITLLDMKCILEAMIEAKPEEKKECCHEWSENFIIRKCVNCGINYNAYQLASNIGSVDEPKPQESLELEVKKLVHERTGDFPELVEDIILLIRQREGKDD